MILESIVTTVDAEGRVNIAPMGPSVEPDDGERFTWEQFTLRPFTGSTTYGNLQATGRAVIHVTDDVGLFARAAVGTLPSEELPLDQLVEPVAEGRWFRLRDCHRWFAVEVTGAHGEGPRVEMSGKVLASGTVRPFFGFNRAKHAVIEAAILATRTHLLDAALIEGELQRLRPLVEKTAGPQEREAFGLLCRTIQERTTSGGESVQQQQTPKRPAPPGRPAP